MNTKRNRKKNSEIHLRCTEQEKLMVEKNAKSEGISAYLLRRGLQDDLCKSVSEFIPDWVNFENELSSLWHYAVQNGDKDFQELVAEAIKRIKQKNLNGM